ncbi:hypothetical protein K491DRAFT_728829 [Lophiostoma macrostomum CBS 122681]|uniref:Uncharacterized protein n=1 Tax=Lophiostoma macrostomum CBS 122681 TaxID=1314788 RepID=A0A6A6SYW5_9PLEO|nr:hypothetical protein K491DRAFT_728829 [Lophiostoma macrostomum CBS 122681]
MATPNPVRKRKAPSQLPAPSPSKRIRRDEPAQPLAPHSLAAVAAPSTPAPAPAPDPAPANTDGWKIAPATPFEGSCPIDWSKVEGLGPEHRAVYELRAPWRPGKPELSQPKQRDLLNQQFGLKQNNETWRRKFQKANELVVKAFGLWWLREPTGLSPELIGEQLKKAKKKKKDDKKETQAKSTVKRRVRRTIKYDGDTFTFHIQEPGMGEGKWEEKREVPLNVARHISEVVAKFVEEDTLTMVIETTPKVLDLFTSLFAPKRRSALPAYGYKIIQDEDGSMCFLEIPLNFTQHDVLDLYILASILDSTDACDMALDHFRDTFLQEQKLREEFRNGTRLWTDIPRGPIPNLLDFEPKHLNELWEITPHDDAARVFWLDVLELKHAQAYDKIMSELSEYSDGFLHDYNKRLLPEQRFEILNPPCEPERDYEVEEDSGVNASGSKIFNEDPIEIVDDSASDSGSDVAEVEEVEMEPVDLEDVVESIEHENTPEEIVHGVKYDLASQSVAGGSAVSKSRSVSLHLQDTPFHGTGTLAMIKEEEQEDVGFQVQEEEKLGLDHEVADMRHLPGDAYFIGESVFGNGVSQGESEGDEGQVHVQHPGNGASTSMAPSSTEDQVRSREPSLEQEAAPADDTGPKVILEPQPNNIPGQGLTPASDSGYSSPLRQGSQTAQLSSFTYSPPVGPHDPAQLIAANQHDFCTIYHNHARHNLPCYKLSVPARTSTEKVDDEVDDADRSSTTRVTITIDSIPGFKILNHTGYSRHEFRQLPRIFSDWDWARVRAVNCYEQLSYEGLDYGRDMKPLILPHPIYFDHAYTGPGPCPFQDEFGRWPSHPGHRNAEWHFNPDDASGEVDGDTTMLDVSEEFIRVVEEDTEHIQDQDEEDDIDQGDRDDAEQNEDGDDDVDGVSEQVADAGKKKKKKPGHPKKNSKDKANDEPPPAPWVDPINVPRVQDKDWQPTAPVFSRSGYGLEGWGFQSMAW